jgi:hypothetical protein
MSVLSSSPFSSLQQIPSALSCLAHLAGSGASCAPGDSSSDHTGGLVKSVRGRLGSASEGALVRFSVDIAHGTKAQRRAANEG